MELSFPPSRSGARGLTVDGLAIHSRFDPAIEADRFVAALGWLCPPSCVILLEPGIDHLARSLGERFPRTKMLVVHYDREIASMADDGNNPVWSPPMDSSDAGSAMDDLRIFIENELSEEDISGIRLLPWPPAAKAFPKMHTAVLGTILEITRRLAAGIETTAAFGRRWFSNAIDNARTAGSIVGPLETSSPVVVAAAGFSLGASIPFLRKNRKHIVLVSCSSACPALFHAGIVPDLVVSTDAGYWARCHLAELRAFPRLTLAMPLEAALPPGRETRPLMILDQGSGFERALARICGLESVGVEPNGTVTGTALEIALASTPNAVIVCGLDLCADDLVSHSRPYALDPFVNGGESRLSPAYSRAFVRENALSPERRGRFRLSRQFATYASWFIDNADRFGRRTFRLFPSPVELPGMRAIGMEEAVSLMDGEASFSFGLVTPPPDGKERSGRILRFLNELLTTARNRPDDKDIEEIIKLIDYADILAARKLERSGRFAVAAEKRLASDRKFGDFVEKMKGRIDG
jgi:hypothetical protein